MPKPDAPCARCGHPWRSHEHWREGTNCSIRGGGCDCPFYIRTKPGLWLHKLSQRLSR